MRLFPRLPDRPTSEEARLYLRHARGHRATPFDRWINRRVKTEPRRPPKVLED
ncbi:hypothetical protein [Phenylobacterium sp.]|uniref:hypothetical protein n=1 Tax=Phenylobacterium sp. TaxID=1871053 RepID=UPI002731C1C0|nr:hypothetical protein [Phenylobacterium sp.]MDP1615730.1 hypothetical protein [Phenylobacterium sp.]MDP1988570.1 hypothetical protein [Phenylobacterium sp.]